MKKIFFAFLFFAFVVNAFAQNAGADVRGQVQTLNPDNKQYVPLSKVPVVLYGKDKSSGSWRIISKTISDRNGYFFFYDVEGGEYYVQVNKKKNFKITVSSVEKGIQLQDLPILFY
jgi:hypothetical protein